MPAVLHASLVVERLAVGGRDLVLDHATVMVVARAESAELDWEVIAHTRQAEPVARGTHELRLRCVTAELVTHDGTDDVRLVAHDLSGTAFLVRTVQRTLVFRGSGTLAGFDVGLLRG